MYQPASTAMSNQGKVVRTDSRSTVALLKEADKGIMKDPFVFGGTTHEECPSLPRHFDPNRATIDRFWNDSSLKSANTALFHVQDWYTKISHRNKLMFLRDLITQEMADSKKLNDVAYFLGPPTKDLVYARTQFTRSAYDVAANDHNRAIDDPLYESLRSEYVEWFKSLNDQERFNAVIGLAHLGGSAVHEGVYREVTKILEEKERGFIRNKVLEYLAKKRAKGLNYNVLASKVARRKRRHKQQLTRISALKTKHLPQSNDNSVLGEEPDLLAQLREKMEVFSGALKAMNQIAEGAKAPRKEATNKSTRRKSSKLEGMKKRLRKLDAGLDRIQMLPLWDNRKILSMLPEKSLGFYSSVNDYWRDMVERTRRELKSRKHINKLFKKLEAESVLHRLAPIEEFRGKSPPKAMGKEVSTESKKSQETHGGFVPEDYHEHLDVDKVFTLPFPKVNIFSKPFSKFEVSNEFVDDRVMDTTHRWVAYSKKTDVLFSNLIFGVPCNLRLVDAHSSKITCICFHSDGAQVFTGGYDGEVKLHDVWKHRVKLIYAGHRGIVLDIVASCRYVASCSMDNTVRVFNIADGRSIMCLPTNKETPSKLLITNCSPPLLYMATHLGEIALYKVEQSDESHQLGSTMYAHQGEVTDLRHYPCVLLTSGVDGFVRMWATNLKRPHWIQSLKHPVRVNSAAFWQGKVISAAEDGKVRIWDVSKGACDREIISSWRPILCMNVIETSSSIKLVLSLESKIEIIEFSRRKELWKKKKKSARPTSILKPVADLKSKMMGIQPSLTASERRMMKLQMRQAALPSIRPPPNMKSRHLIQDRPELL